MNILSLRTIKSKLGIKRREILFPFESYQKEKNCIFIHIPKNAGTSVLSSLGKQGAGGRYHLPWYVYFNANPEFFTNAFKFAFIRNPWDRAVSAFEYLRAGGNKKGDLQLQKQFAQFNDFDDFVINGLSNGAYRNHLLFIPQSEFVVNGEGDLVVDFLGRFESLDSDFEKVAEALQLPRLLSKRNQNQINKKQYQRYYKSIQTIEIIEHIYKQDIHLFRYEFEQ